MRITLPLDRYYEARILSDRISCTAALFQRLFDDAFLLVGMDTAL